jgi:hypothetical protein
VGEPELEEYRQQFEEITSEARILTEGLNEARFNWRPAPDEWSIEECLAHLTMAGQWSVRAIEEAIQDARAQRLTGTGPFHYNALDRIVISIAEPPVRLKFSSPARFVPVHGQPLTAIMPTFFHMQAQLNSLTERAEGLDLARVKVATPMPVLKMSLGATFAHLAAHERRHMAQAKRVLARMGAGAVAAAH